MHQAGRQWATARPRCRVPSLLCTGAKLCRFLIEKPTHAKLACVIPKPTVQSAPAVGGEAPQPAMWAAVVENATAAGHGRREDERAWVRSRETPPSPAMALTHAKITSWLDRGGDVDVTTMECAPPSLPPLLSALSQPTFGDCQLLIACAASSLPAPALTP